MKVSVVGQDTLAAAIAECCAAHFAVSRSPEQSADVLWLAYDTPIGPGDVPDVEFVMMHSRDAISKVGPATLVLLSSQVPIGTTDRLNDEFPAHLIAYSPENIRVASGVADFRQQARIVVGRNNPSGDATFAELLAPFTSNIIWTTPETAEMAKHALNAFLGLQIAFINEIARIGHPWGVDMEAVTKALRTERRISPNAPLQAGKPFGGGHLARDIHVLTELARTYRVSAPIISHIHESNQ